ALSLAISGMLALFSGQASEAEYLFQEAQALRRLVDAPGGFFVDAWSSWLPLLRGNLEDARAAGEKVLKLAKDFGHWVEVHWALQVIGVVACIDEDYARGKRLGEEAERFFEQHYAFPWYYWCPALANCGLRDYAAASQHIEALQRLGISHKMPLAHILSL